MRAPHIDRFHAAAFDPGVASTLHLELKADPAMLAAAQAEHKRLADAEASGIFDRCHISKRTHAVLTAALSKT